MIWAASASSGLGVLPGNGPRSWLRPESGSGSRPGARPGHGTRGRPTVRQHWPAIRFSPASPYGREGTVPAVLAGVLLAVAVRAGHDTGEATEASTRRMSR